MKFIDLKKYVNHIDLINTLSGGVANTSIMVEQKPDEIVIKAQAPSVPAEAYDIVINDNKLILFSSNENREKSIPLFEQIFDIPSFVEAEDIYAEAENDQIRIFMPFKPQGDRNKTRRIQIRHNS